ncbi:MAG: hypothetical protein IJ704_04415 [Bacilli bacterium]|nr:hypothetical protein [Bacilli bacterium]
MNNNNMTTFIIIMGIFIIGVFTAVLGINMLPNYESNSYYGKVENEMTAKIESFNVIDGFIQMHTSGNATAYCIKTTRTTPSSENMCWKELKNGNTKFSAYENKKYYIWLKDENGNISSPKNLLFKKGVIYE